MAVIGLKGLKVPYALDISGNVVAPFAATRGGAYTCLECAGRLDLRRSRLERPHFAHRSDALKACTGESATHLAAKHLLRAQLEQELEAHGCVSWQVACAGTGRAPCRDHATLRQETRLVGWDTVALEVPYGPYRFDVAVMHQGRVVYGFEVYFRHQVPQDKAEALKVPWLELLAEDILEYRPRIPLVSAGNAQNRLRCPSCEALGRLLEQRTASDQQRSSVHAAFVAESRRVNASWQEILEHARRKSAQKAG